MAGNARELALFSAKIAEQAERYTDMVEEMKRIAGMAGEQVGNLLMCDCTSAAQDPCRAACVILELVLCRN